MLDGLRILEEKNLKIFSLAMCFSLFSNQVVKCVRVIGSWVGTRLEIRCRGARPGVVYTTQWLSSYLQFRRRH